MKRILDLVCVRLHIIIVTACFVGFFAMPGFAQQDMQQQKDSLRKVLDAAEGREKLRAYSRLAFLYFPESPQSEPARDTLLTLYNELFAEAEKQEVYSTCSMAAGNILLVYYKGGQYDEIFKRAPGYLQFMADHEQWPFYYQTYGFVIAAYIDKGESDNALREAQKMYDYAKARDDAGGMGVSLFEMSIVYAEQRRLEEQEKCLRECIAMLDGRINYAAKSTDAYQELAINLIKQERFDDVLQVAGELEKVVIPHYEEVSKSPQPNARRMVYSIFTDVYLQSKRYEEAEIYLNKQDSILDGADPLYSERAQILMGRKRYPEALEMAEKAIEDGYTPRLKNSARGTMMMIRIEMHDTDGAMQTFKDIVATMDSIHSMEINAQLDKIRTQYEIDKHIAEKEKTRNYLLFALAGCLLLAIALGIWIYLHRQIARKNRSLYLRIQELLQKEKVAEQQLLDVPEEKLSRAMLLFRQLSELMQKEKAFTDPELNRKKLADRLCTNEHYLADAIREATGETFSTYLANLRLQYALKLMSEQPSMTFDVVAIDSGLGSYASFFRLFTKKYGITPSEYRKQAS
jgi:AraC-like DNA-binding protein